MKNINNTLSHTKETTVKKSKTKSVLKGILLFNLCLMAIFSIGIFSYLLYINQSLKFDENSLRQINTEFHLYDNNNQSLENTFSQNSTITLNELPAYVPASFISIEDKNFYNHKGLNYKRIVKALINNLKSGYSQEGASTISQQLIKNTHLSNEKTLNRKIKEMLLTKKMESKLSKNEILQTYLNAIYFGNGAYGIDNASKIYFNKGASELSVSESAMLAGLIKSPKKYSPIFEQEACLKRRNIVLKEMVKDNIISNEIYQNAINEPLNVSVNIINNQNFYEKAVLEEASNILGISEKELASKGYYIFTYLDNNAQNSLTNACNDDSFYHQNSYGKTADSAGIIIDNKTNGVIAFNGKSKYDIVNMKRSPGSSIKPILVYAPALENGKISPITPILDEPTTFSGYSPQNVGGKYYGYISATESIEKSLNIPAIKIMQITGIEKCKQMANKCGINFDKQDSNYAIALGGMTKGTTIKELVNSFTTFAHNGQYKDAKFIRKICDKNGNVIYKHSDTYTKAMSNETAYLMTEMLISGVKKGTSARLKDLPYEVAGKTGTVGIKNTNLNSDVWSVSYTTDHTFGIWLGNSTGEKEYMLEGCNNGGTYCTSMLKDVMQNVYKSKPYPSNFEKPSEIVSVELDSLELNNNHALLLAESNTPDMFKISANFNKKYVPTAKAKNFNTLKAIELNVKMIDNTPTLSFNALQQVEYRVFRINDDESKIIKTIKNKKGNIEIKDELVEKDELYIYYIEAFSTNHATDTRSKKIKSNSVKVFTN